MTYADMTGAAIAAYLAGDRARPGVGRVNDQAVRFHFDGTGSWTCPVCGRSNVYPTRTDAWRAYQQHKGACNG